jgi:predicted ATPase/DNA-binding SARP family transcriptional activator
MLTLTLLGQVAIARDGEPLSRFRSQTEIALLVYLAQTGQVHTREALADLLWDANSTAQSLSNLRTALTRLRAHIGDELLITRTTVAMRPESRQAIDSVRLQSELQTSAAPQSLAAAAHLAATLRLYKGDFLAGFYLAGAPRFNDWAVVEQERLRQQVIVGLQRLIVYAQERPDPPLGIEAARQWLTLDELSETAHAHLIHLLAINGQITDALAQAERLTRLLDEELGLPPQPATLQLIQRIQKGKIAPAPLSIPHKQRTLSHNLPRELTPFVGRAAERAALVERLLDPACPLVTLTGQGGMGKTRLALAAAREIAESATDLFPDGMGFVSLAEMDKQDATHDALATAIGAALKLSFQRERRPAQQLLSLLAPMSCLIILDNCEHLLDSVLPDLVMDLLHTGSGVHLLATSTVPLDLNSEFVVRLAGLPVPHARVPAGAENAEIAAYDSVRLFVEYARRTGAPFHATEDVTENAAEMADIATICRTLNGIPLAIKLAAAWVGQMPLAQIATAIAANVDFLSTRQRDVPVRQRSMRAVFDYAWRLLGPTARRILAQTSVFRSGFDQAAGMAVTGADGAEIDRLVSRSLLEQDADGRYAVHELVREFAAEKLAEADASNPPGLSAENRVSERHGAYYLRLVGSIAPPGPQSEAAIAAVRCDLDNVRQAWRWAVAGPHPDALDIAWRGLLTFYIRHSLFQEGEEAFGNAVAALGSAGLAAGETGWVLARLQIARADLLNILNRYEDAVALARAVLDFAVTHDDTLLVALGCLQWGTALFRQGFFDDALPQLGRGLSALVSAQPDSQLPVEADIRLRIGAALLEKGELTAARAAFELALTIYRGTGMRTGEADVLSGLGWLEQRAMNFATAQAHLEAALTIQRSLHVQHGVTLTLINLANVVDAQADFGQAYTLRLEALDNLERIDDRYHRSLVNHGLGVLLSRLGDYGQARIYYERALAIDREVGDMAGVAWTQNNLGLLYQHLGELERALALHQEALGAARACGARTIEGLALSRMGQDLHGLGRLDEAVCAMEAAIEIQHDLHQTVWAMESTAELAVIYVKMGQPKAAAVVEALLPDLEAVQPLHGAREPFRVYWNCYSVLAATHDPRATGLLAAANAGLRGQADKIQNPMLRWSFLENVPVHRCIFQAVV